VRFNGVSFVLFDVDIEIEDIEIVIKLMFYFY